MNKKEKKNFLYLLRSRDERAFIFLYHEFKNKIFNYILRNVGNIEDAKELTQDVFLSIYKNIHTYKGQSSLSTWIYRIATNKVINFINRKQKKFEKNLSISDKIHLKSKQLKPEEQLYRTELEKMVQEGLKQMEPDLRIIVILRDIQGFSYQEIGEILNLKQGTVKSKLHYARKKLKHILEAKWMK